MRWELKCENLNLNCNYHKLLIFWHLTVALEYTGMILKSNCILCLFWNFIFYNKNEIWLTNLNREKRFIFLDIDKTRNNNINRNNWSDSAAASVQQCDTAYALREEKGTNGWRRALARQSEAKAVTFWRANGDQVAFSVVFLSATPSTLSSRVLKLYRGAQFKQFRPTNKIS